MMVAVKGTRCIPVSASPCRYNCDCGGDCGVVVVVIVVEGRDSRCIEAVVVDTVGHSNCARLAVVVVVVGGGGGGRIQINQED